MNQLAVSGDNRTVAMLYEHVSCSRTRASRTPRRCKACFAPLSAASRLMSSPRRVPRLDPRFRGDDTCWLGRLRCSTCFEASPKTMFVRELMPQDRKIEIEQLSSEEAIEVAGFLKWTPFAGPRAVEIKVESRLPFLSSFFSFETL